MGHDVLPLSHSNGYLSLSRVMRSPGSLVSATSSTLGAGSMRLGGIEREQELDLYSEDIQYAFTSHRFKFNLK